MIELLDAYDQSGIFLKTAERKALLKEMKSESEQKGDCSFAVPCINLMLVDKNGDLYVVQRGDKPENPFLYDKTVGGHVSSGEGFDETLRRETAEEIGIDLIISNPFDFHRQLKSVNLEKVALVKLIDYKIWLPSLRVVQDGAAWTKRVQLAAYMGRYDGDLEFMDGEALSLKKMSREQLSEAIQQNPTAYTDDLKWWFKHYPAFLWD